MAAIPTFLACPHDQTALQHQGNLLTCAVGHQFQIIDGIPILLTGEEQAHWGQRYADPALIEEAFVADRIFREAQHAIDPEVADTIVGTNGNLYRHLRDKLPRYPIPELRLPPGDGKLFLDVGCGWGRWSIAAAMKGYRVIASDPNIIYLLMARRVAAQMEIDIQFVLTDARHLGFSNGSFDAAFSYSVLQHLPPEGCWQALSEVGRVLRPGGVSLIQLANCAGVRSVYSQAMRGFRNPEAFEVRYYSLRKMWREAQARIGETKISVDGYFGLGVQPADRDLMEPFGKTVIAASEILRAASRTFPPIRYIADSLYIESTVPP